MSATQGTEIASLEAARNEAEVLAEGALLGERRAAIARIAMVTSFALVSNLDAGQRSDRAQFVVGATYMVFAVVTLWILMRRATAIPRRARLRPLALTVVDYTFITTMAIIDMQRGVGFESGQHVIAASILMSFAVARYGVLHVAFSATLAIASYCIAAWYGHTLLTFSTIFIVAGMAGLALIIGLTNRAVSGMFRGLRQRDNLTRFLPRQVAERIMKIGPGALAPVEREVTVLFSDIRGFTTMSEGMGPSELLRMLDDYFGRMSQIVKGHDGVVGKFLGDGMLAFWGVPDRLDDHAVRAVRAARDMRRALRELNQHRETQGLPPMRVGIGIHTGTVAAGMLGGQLQSEYTIIGDAVNVASRIEGLTKEHAIDVLISETTWAQLGDNRRGARVASAEIRGRKELVTLYSLDGSEATLEVSPVANAGGSY
ncbi:MAG: adenylate/guanylate cyclase domain-containing protein [Kofleriaceae bacterium]